MIFDGTADVLISPSSGYEATLVFYIVVGILMGIASILVILIVQRSAKGFFSQSQNSDTNA
jgi:hypothetical protein